MRYLVTGATGNIGSLVTRRLVERGERPAVLARDAAKARAGFGDDVEIRVGDLSADMASLSASLGDIDSLFLLNTGPDLAARDAAVARAAREAGVRQIREGRVETVTGELERLLGRPPATFAQWAEEHARDFVRPARGRGAPSSPPRPSRSRAR
ncbi:MAG: NAD(P)H-binding protein [Sandaracinaceae bacterium]|nr:NAD(P)H-binding protein [Sandaracinaceae bacterium]